MVFQILMLVLAALVAAVFALVSIPPLRCALLSRKIFKVYKSILPQMSETERDSLEAGTVWWEGELFRGNPDWCKLLAYPVPTMTAEEQSFMDNEVEQACTLVQDWQVTTELNDMSPEAWGYIKERGFLGIIIPKK